METLGQPALAAKAKEIRRHVIRMLASAGSGHPGSSLSEVELITTLYFGGVLRHDPRRPDWPDRDRFILSKGHGCPTLYAVLAEAGYFSRDELPRLRKIGSLLEGHPNRRRTPGIEASTGSLGQGLSFGAGAALAARIDGVDRRVWVLLGDGEIQEGQVWEAAMFAGHRRLSNLKAIVDANGFQLDDATAKILDPEPIAAKFEAFGWAAREIDGHDLGAVRAAYDWAIETTDRPAAIVARTVKGKGVSFMEGNNHWHGVAPNQEERDRALAELA